MVTDIKSMDEIYFFVNNILTDSSSSSDEENIRHDRRPRLQNFENIIALYAEEEFKRNFRVSRTTFTYILSKIANEMESSFGQSGRNTISAEKQLYMAMWYFATPDSYRSICNKFDIGNATGFRSVHRVTEGLLSIAHTVIVWPTGPALESTINGYSRIGFPNTIGCIDGSYIPIPMPTEHGLQYICRKGFTCVHLQGVCDHTLKFTHCYAGEAGSVHDAKVLGNSEVNLYMTVQANDKFPNGTHLLGDKSYPLSETLMTPYKNTGHLTPLQMNYNFKLSTARSTIERAFALLKNRWRCLKYLDVRDLKWIPKYIIACCILHNMCIAQNDMIGLEESEPADGEECEEMVLNQPGRAEQRERLITGNLKRNRIANELHVL